MLQTEKRQNSEDSRKVARKVTLIEAVGIFGSFGIKSLQTKWVLQEDKLKLHIAVTRYMQSRSDLDPHLPRTNLLPKKTG